MQALSGLGDAHYLQGRILSALEYFVRCVALSEQAGFMKVQIPNRAMVGHCLYYANRFDECVAQIRQSLDDARRAGQAQSEIFIQESLGLLLAANGEYEAAEAAIMTGIPRARTAGARRYLSMMLYILAQIRMDQQKREEAKQHLAEALALAQQTGMAFAGPLILSGIAGTEQDPDLARRALAQGETILREFSVSHCHLHFYRNAIDVNLGMG